MRPHTSAHVSIRQHTNTHTHIQHTHRTSSLATLRRESSASSTGWAHRYYSVDLLYWYKSTNTDTPATSPHTDADSGAYVAKQLYLLYWYKSTNTDTPATSPHTDADSGAYVAKQHGRRFAKDSVYLLYWYKSTNTDAEGAAGSRKNIAEHYDLGNDMY
jgi:hypothetical protein